MSSKQPEKVTKITTTNNIPASNFPSNSSGYKIESKTPKHQQ
jgi:hypothetical protein